MINPYIRWMIRRDMDEVCAIEEACFQWDVWNEKDFVDALREFSIIGMVAEHDETIVAFMVYEVFKHRIDILNFAVLPDVWRQGVGTAMVAKLTGKLSDKRWTRLTLAIDEINLAGQLFFASQGFRAVGIDRDPWDAGRDAYKMVYRVQSRRAVAREEANEV